MTAEKICDHCGSDDMQKRGTNSTGKQRYQCQECGKWGLGEKIAEDVSIKEPENEKEFTFLDAGQTAIATALVEKDSINSTEKLFQAMNIDPKIWEIEKKLVAGKTVKSFPVFTVKLWLRRRTDEILKKMILRDYLLSANQLSLKKLPGISFENPKDGFMYEVEMPDIHIGKLAWGEESGDDTDLKIQVAQARKVMCELLSYAEKFPISKILFPIGHDFYNVDNQFNTTSHGTPQQEDTRWRKTFRVGWNLAAELINMCAQIAPVEVPIVGGNHDEERSFYLGEVLSALYQNSNGRVVIDNSPRDRKYILFGSNLIGLTHGYYEKIRELKDIMSFEQPDLWAQSKYREWHTGDKHHKEDFVHKTHEANNGVVIRILRSLSPADLWHYRKGFIGALRASEAFLWHKEEGLKGQFTASP